MRLAITGATGNIGTALLRRLARDRQHELVGLCRRVPEVPPTPVPVTWVPVDLTDDSSPGVLERAFECADAVVHLAWGFQPSHRPAYLEELGVGGTRRVLYAASVARVRHLVHMSSVGVYSPKADDEPVTETWPRGGVPSSPYSRHKVAAERILDRYEESDEGMLVTRFRPGIVGQRSAGSALLRYGLPALAPSWLLGHVPLLPLDRRLALPMVHADDVADAVARELEQRTGGAYNLAAEPPVTTDLVAETLRAHPVHVPSSLLRPLVSGAWHARLQPVDAGWLDMAFAVPLLDATRARRGLGWSPSYDATEVLGQVIAGMRERERGGTPVLRPRSVMGGLTDWVRRGPVGHRRDT